MFSASISCCEVLYLLSYARVESIIFEIRPLEYCHMTSEDPKYGREIILKISTEFQDS